MGVPTIEEEESGNQASSPNTLSSNFSNMSELENNFDFIDIPKKKKIFSSSSFYEEPNAIYPTVEEQVEMCRKIADSLSDDCNKKSKGANMFFKRVRRAEKWVVPSSMFGGEFPIPENNNIDPATLPYVRINKEPPKLKLMLDPRHIIDLKRLREEGVQIVESTEVSKGLIQNIVNDLNSPTGKGAQLFAKRKKKSMEWVVDDDKVKAHLRQIQDRERGIFTPEPSQGDFSNFKRLSSDEVADSIIKAAEAKVMSYPAPRHSAIEPVHYYAEPAITEIVYEQPPLPQLEPPPQPNQWTNIQSPTPAIPTFKTGLYSCKGPIGWRSPTPSMRPASMFDIKSYEHEDISTQAPSTTSGQTNEGVNQNFPAVRTYSFSNFNTIPKAWSPTPYTDIKNIQYKKIKPPLYA